MLCWLLFLFRWAGFHPRMWKKMNKFQSSVAPRTRNFREGINRSLHSIMNSLKCLKSWLFNILPLFPLLSLNAGVSKDAGTARLMARLELCKKQPARLSSSGTRAKPKAFLPPANTLVHVSFSFVQSDAMNASQPLVNA